MLSLFKLTFTLAVVFLQLSSAAVLPRHGWRNHAARPRPFKPYNPWSPWGFRPSASKSLAAPAPTNAPGGAPGIPTFTAPSAPTSTIDEEEDEPTQAPAPIDDEQPAAPVSNPAARPTGPALAPPQNNSPPAPKKSSSPDAPEPTQPAAAPVTPATPGSYWKPAAGLSWQIELSGQVTDTDYPVDVFDLDLFDTPASTISALQANGKKVICYFSAGTFEDWRSDKASFQAADKGAAMEDWAGEWWLNTNSANVRKIMTTRLDLAKSKGCDAVDPDNVDGFNNNNGINLQSSDAVNYLTWMSTEAHSRGLAIGLKNAADLVKPLLPIMDFHVNEQCLEFNECALFAPFVAAGKPVFHIEYPENAPASGNVAKSGVCGSPSIKGFSTVMKTLALDQWIETC